MANQAFDVVVIGGGPGGYVAAIRAAQLGLKAACVESRGALGGTCLNVGCIPSKSMLEASEMFVKILHAKDFGINVKEASPDIQAILKRKDTTVSSLTKGVEGIFKKNKIAYLKGHGSFASANQVKVTDGAGNSEVVDAKSIIIATGSEPIELPFAKFDGQHVVTSTEALEFTEVPKHLVVIGAGVIGLEMGSVWLRLGAKVSVVEAAPEIMFNMDAGVRAAARKIFTKQGFEFFTDTKVKEINKTKDGAVVIADSPAGKVELKADKVLVAVGRRPYTKGLDVQNAGVALDERGRVKIDGHFRTNVPNVYAIGDVVIGPMLAHKAEEEGIAAAEIIAGKAGHVNYEAIPNVIYTWPEIASVGMTEEQLKEKGIDFKSGQFPFLANGRAKAMGTTDGFVKLLADAKTDRLLGAHIIGPMASEMIAEMAIAFEFGASAEDIARSSHAHPTLAEVIKEAALAVDKRTIHI